MNLDQESAVRLSPNFDPAADAVREAARTVMNRLPEHLREGLAIAIEERDSRRAMVKIRNAAHILMVNVVKLTSGTGPFWALVDAANMVLDAVPGRWPYSREPEWERALVWAREEAELAVRLMPEYVEHVDRSAALF